MTQSMEIVLSRDESTIPTLPPLGPLTATTQAGSPIGTVIATLTNLQHNEVISYITPSYLTTNPEGTQVLVGAVIGFGPIYAIVTTSLNRVLTLVITVTPEATIVLFPDSVDENLPVDTIIGSLTIDSGTGDYSFFITNDPDGKFKLIDGNKLALAAEMDYETKDFHEVTIRATNGLGGVLSGLMRVIVNNVLEGTLGPTAATVMDNAAVGYVVATITGLDTGANERATNIIPGDSFSLSADGTQVLVAKKLSMGINDILVSTSGGRSYSMTITVVETIPDGAILNYSGGYVINEAGGYVLRAL